MEGDERIESWSSIEAVEEWGWFYRDRGSPYPTIVNTIHYNYLCNGALIKYSLMARRRSIEH
jgi:hypothetical protein